MRSLCLVVAIGLAGCGDAVPTNADCTRAVAQMMFLEGLDALGDADLSREVGKDIAGAPAMSERQALEIIKNAELGSMDAKRLGEGERRIKHCRAKRTRDEALCIQRAPTLADAKACVREPAKH